MPATSRAVPLREDALRAVAPYYDLNRGIPLEPRVVERLDGPVSRREKVVFRGVRRCWVPGYLEVPTTGGGPFPCVLLLHGWSWSKASWYDEENEVSGGRVRRGLLAAGFATLALDAQMHGDRVAESDYAVYNLRLGPHTEPQPDGFTLAEICQQTVRDYRRGLDYLETRAEIDPERIGAFGYSMGAWQVFPLAAFEPRVRVVVAAALPTEKGPNDPVAPQSYAGAISQPFLLQMGTQDEMATREGAEELQKYVSSQDKRLVWYDGGHYLPNAYVADAVAWLQSHVKAGSAVDRRP
jgi:dienelactone hydrolase